jgi:hypothetical protein
MADTTLIGLQSNIPVFGSIHSRLSAMADRPVADRPPPLHIIHTATDALQPYELQQEHSTSPRSRIQHMPTDASAFTLASIPIPPLDPSPHDPSATFIRWPFKQTINWVTLIRHPNWFLEPGDFNYEGAPPYPTELEPPRGWGPPKAKRGNPIVEIDKAKEENRLRCTFCRRTYGGVNAKSMWRRHVYDKHKVAMRNRRDNGEKLKGKGSECKLPSGVTAELNPTIAEENIIAPAKLKIQQREEKVASPTPVNSKKRRSVDVSAGPIHLFEKTRFLNAPGDNIPEPFTPPSTPPPNDSELSSTELGHIKSSPYDPTRTPQFIHSRPPEPLENALRFPNTSQMLCNLLLSPQVRAASPSKQLDSPFSGGVPSKSPKHSDDLPSLSLRESPFFKRTSNPFPWDLSQGDSSQSTISFSSTGDQLEHPSISSDDAFSFFNTEGQHSIDDYDFAKFVSNSQPLGSRRLHGSNFEELDLIGVSRLQDGLYLEDLDGPSPKRQRVSLAASNR